MRAKRPEDKSKLSLRQGFFDAGALCDAHRALIGRVFGNKLCFDLDDGSAHWRIFGLYDDGGCCVAGVEARLLPVQVGGRRANLTGLRRVGVDEAWRGLGLLRAIMEPAIRWCASESSDPSLLYAEEPALYERFGFTRCPQHAFVGTLSSTLQAPPSREIDMRSTDGIALLRRLLDARAAVSSQCALVGAPDLVLHNIRSSLDVRVAYADDLEAAIVYEVAGDDLVLVDVIAARIPPMAAMVASLCLRPRTITTLFPPDRLEWTGHPVEDDTGLMSRGPLPEAMTRPFMLPPTSEF